jgi:SAM-dependent methyltransferase
VRDYHPADSFDEESAARYDEHRRGDEDVAVALLAELAGDGPALELAIGTGRIALPLAARAIRVDGIDISEAMVAQLRAKPGGADLDVVIGDMADVPVDGEYQLVYVVFNSLFNLLIQDDQVRCFENVAAHLRTGGVFVIEAFTPWVLVRMRDDQYVDAERVEPAAVHLDVARHDPVTQTLDENHVRLSPRGVELNPIVTRYAWPSELDLMARIAGLRLRDRWGDWNRRPFAGDSSLHVSVYARTARSR